MLNVVRTKMVLYLWQDTGYNGSGFGNSACAITQPEGSLNGYSFDIETVRGVCGAG